MTYNKLLITLIIIFGAVFIGIGLFLNLYKKNRASLPVEENQTFLKQEPLALPTEIPTEGTLTLNVQDEQNVSPAVNSEFRVYFEGNSSGKNIVGYDIVLNYDPQVFEFVRAESLLNSFKVHAFDKNDYLILTGVRSLSSEPVPLTDTKMISLVFKAKISGPQNLSPVRLFENDKTDFITDKTAILYPELFPLMVNVTE